MNTPEKRASPSLKRASPSLFIASAFVASLLHTTAAEAQAALGCLVTSIWSPACVVAITAGQAAAALGVAGVGVGGVLYYQQERFPQTPVNPSDVLQYNRNVNWVPWIPEMKRHYHPLEEGNQNQEPTDPEQVYSCEEYTNEVWNSYRHLMRLSYAEMVARNHPKIDYICYDDAQRVVLDTRWTL